MIENYYAIIMAGGGGTRLWPLSRKSRPKQMLRLFDKRTMFQTTVDRLEGVFPEERILVVTVEEQAKELRTQCPQLPTENFLIEPMPKGTASVVGLAAMALKNRDPQAVMAILTSDHYIGNEERFRHVLEAAYDVAMDRYLVTLGIEPTFAATGFGYIHQGEHLGKYIDLDVYRVRSFKEKPDEAQAEQMLASGEYTWNSGMFVWRAEQIMAEIDRQMPGLASSLGEISRSWGTDEQESTIQRIWPQLKTETIDYGVMEKAERVAVIPASDLEWSDIGSWDSLFDLLKADENGNIVMAGEHLGLDTRQSLIYAGQDQRLIVTIGVEDLVVVDTGDVLLVCSKEQAQRVRQVVDYLKKNDGNFE